MDEKYFQNCAKEEYPNRYCVIPELASKTWYSQVDGSKNMQSIPERRGLINNERLRGRMKMSERSLKGI